MTFLALTALEALLLAAGTVGIIVALYFLKVRHRRVVVASSMLWRRVIDERQGQSLWERLRTAMSILIAATIALLIAMSIAQPQMVSLTGEAERILIVLDTSPSMAAATRDGRTRWRHAVDSALRLLEQGSPTTEFRVLDTSGGSSSSFTTSRSELRRTLDGMSPGPGKREFPKLNPEGAQVFFISDGVSVRDLPEFARRISVYEPANNVAITAFDVRSVPAAPLSSEAYLEVHNFGDADRNVTLTLTGSGTRALTKTMNLAKSDVYKGIFDLSQFSGTVRATIESPDDSLSEDNSVFAYLPAAQKTRTLLVTSGNTLLEKVLRVDPHVELSLIDPGNFRERPDVDVYIFDRFAPPEPPSKPSLIVGAPTAAWLRGSGEVVDKPVVSSWAEDHPLMQSVSIYDLSVERARKIDASNLSVLVASKEAPLIVASENPKWVMLTFDLNASDFPLHLGFPIFIDNVLSWFRRDSLVVASAGSPGNIEVPVGNAEVRDLDGKIVPSKPVLGHTSFVAVRPGLYTATSGGATFHVAVNMANPTLSDINQSSFGNDAAPVPGRYFLARELWFYMLIAALILIGVEWFTYHRRITL